MKYSRISPAEAERMARRDRNRLIGFTVLAVLLGASYLVVQNQSKNRRAEAEREQRAELPGGGAETQIYVPEFDAPEVLESIADGTEAERQSLADEPLEAVFRYARSVGDASMMDALGRRELDGAVRQELMEAPAEHRLDALRIRGRVAVARRRPRDGALKGDWIGTLRDLDGEFTHFLAARAPKQANQLRGVAPGDYLRMDGVFHSIHSVPVEIDGEIVEVTAPLVVGRDLMASIPPISAELARETPALADVKDDPKEGAEFDPAEFDDARWQLLGKAQLVGEEIDWEAAPELDNELLQTIFENPDEYRGVPVRIPISVNMDTFTEVVGDNPLRLPRITQGWIANMTWKGPATAIRWYGPFIRRDMRHKEINDENRYVTGKGFFFRNHRYASRDGTLRRAPVFVMHDVEIFTPEPSKTIAYTAYFVLGGTIFLIVVIYLLLMADKRRSNELYEEMLRRKRARRERQADGGPGPSDSSPSTA